MIGKTQHSLPLVLTARATQIPACLVGTPILALASRYVARSTAFGSWTWDAFYEMLANYSSTTGIKNIAVYAWQFVPHSWSDGKLLPPADQTCDGAAVLCTSDENCTTWLKENNCGTDYAAYCRSDNNNCHISKAPEPTPSPSPSPSPSKPCFGEPVECKSTEECKAYVLTHNCTGVSYSYCRDGGFCQFHER